MGNFGGSTDSLGVIGNAADSYIKNGDSYGVIGDAVDSYLGGGSNDAYGTIGSVADSYINNGSTSLSGSGGLTSSLGSLLGKYGKTIFGSLAGAGLGAADNARKKDLIKSSYYKNPYLTSALTPEYSLSDNINNLMGTLGMLGGNGVNGGFTSNLFKGSLIGGGNDIDTTGGLGATTNWLEKDVDNLSDKDMYSLLFGSNNSSNYII